jgi:hypothetical protein
MKKNRKTILVTGAHHSGTTWTGKVIAFDNSVSYIYEPFNLISRKGNFGGDFQYWFTYISDENEKDYQKHFERCLTFKYNYLQELKDISSFRDIGRMSRDIFHFFKSRVLSKRALLKDPIAIFSVEWLFKNFNIDVILLIRHPAAFVGSMKKGKSAHPFDHFLKQPILMKEHLQKYQSEIEAAANGEIDEIGKAILLWNIIYSMVVKYQTKYPAWYFIKHEDLASEPKLGFKKIYSFLGLAFTTNIERKLEALTSAKSNHSYTKRDSKATIKTWKKRLTAQEVQRVKEGTKEIASYFYQEADWK